MNTFTLKIGPLVLGAVVLGLVAAGAGYGLAQRGGHSSNAPSEAAATAGQGAAAPAAGERKVLYWYDPMKPEARFDKPGKSPFMDMQLVPRYADESATAGVQIDPALSQSLGVRLVPVVQEALATRVEAPGTLGFNDRDVAIVQARTGGFVERVYARAPGDVVAAGAPLVDVLVPEWAGAQQEFLAVRATGQAELAAASRQRLVLMGMPAALIEEVERSGRAQPLQTITSPIGGVIQELMVRAGMSLAPGMTLARIGGLSSLWLEVAVPEVHAGLLAVGQSVQATLSAYPGQTFNGRIAAVLPDARLETRTLRVRIELPNPGGRLRAGMAALAVLSSAAQPALVVPSEAVIRTGQRALVFVAGDTPGRYTPVTVELGREVGGKLVILKGLAAGQQVVASGQFLIDSEASLAGVVARGVATSEAAPGTTAPGAKLASVYETLGVVEAIEPAELTLQHEPVQALKWPAMSMPFMLKSPQQAAGLKVGDRVRFSFSQSASGVVVERIRKEAVK